MTCPNCNNGTQFIKEETPFGWTQCCNCNYKATHKEFNVDVLNSTHNTKITNSPLGLKVSGKNDDYISIAVNENKNICIDGELNYINSISLNKIELEILIYKLTEMHSKLDR